MKNFETLQEQEPAMNDFKAMSITYMVNALATGPYPGYPDSNERLHAGDFWDDAQPWETSPGKSPTLEQQQAFIQEGLELDDQGRPLHPWFREMYTNPDLGIVTGKGRYWNWGPNYTADPIVLRHDLGEPHVLLIVRNDTGNFALPGGFIDPGESGLTAAIRESDEETLVDVSNYADQAIHIYQGPLADARTTVNAWPETSAYLFDLPAADSAGMPIGPYQIADKDSGEQTTVCWVPESQLADSLFGSHKLLIQMALNLSEVR